MHNPYWYWSIPLQQPASRVLITAAVSLLDQLILHTSVGKSSERNRIRARIFACTLHVSRRLLEDVRRSQCQLCKTSTLMQCCLRGKSRSGVKLNVAVVSASWSLSLFSDVKSVFLCLFLPVTSLKILRDFARCPISYFDRMKVQRHLYIYF